MNTTPELHCDVLIIGSGAAGLSLALRLAEHQNVIVLSKGPISEGSTFYAQGGIAAVFDETDSIASHVEDTLIARAGSWMHTPQSLSPAMPVIACSGSSTRACYSIRRFNPTVKRATT